MGSPGQRLVTSMWTDAQPQTLCRTHGTLFFHHADVIVCVAWQCLHQRNRGHCMLVASGKTQQSPQEMPLCVLTTIAVAGLAVIGWVPPFRSRLCVFKHLCCPSTQAERVGVLGPQPHFCLSLANTPFTSRSFLLGKCTVSNGFLWPGGKESQRLTSQMTTVVLSLSTFKMD